MSKRNADDATAGGVHGMAAGAYPFLKDWDPAEFTRLLSKAEIALGVALLIRAVPPLAAGAALAGFAGGLVGLYLRTPGMWQERQEGPRTGADLDRLAIGTVTALTAIHQAAAGPLEPVESWRFPHRIAKRCGKRHESTVWVGGSSW